MTLFIAWLIIYGFDMNPWLYVLATVIWVTRVVISWRVQFGINEDIREVGHYAREASRVVGNLYERTL